MKPALSLSLFQPAVHRLKALAPLDDAAENALRKAMENAVPVRKRHEFMTEGREIGGARVLVSGWAARVRLLADGRRQLISFVLPGDLMGYCGHPKPRAASTVVALTDAACAPAPDAGRYPALYRAYESSRAIEEYYLLAQITRLGRFTAIERIADLFLELYERLELSGLASDNRFLLPLTQEILADMLGLTPVHISRMLQLARRDRQFDWRGGEVVLFDPARLAEMIGRKPVSVLGS